MATFETLDECDSTNAELLRRAAAGAPSGSVLVARRQTAGRGRRGRLWVSSPEDSLTFSVLWRCAGSPAGLPLAVGVALAEALGEEARLKWPNDLLREGRKFGGILVEMAGGAAVIGVGLNLRLPAGLPDDVRATAAAWGRPVSHGDLPSALMDALTTFDREGFAPFRPRWLARCAHMGATVNIVSDAITLTGRCAGVDDDGALLLETSDGVVQRILSGDVSLRPA